MRSEPEPNAAIEIHDSTLESVTSSGSDVIAAIDAYVHRSRGRAGVDAGTGWSQLVELRFPKGKMSGSVVTSSVDLLGGRLVLSGEVLNNIIPLPLDHSGSSRLELESWNDVRVVFEGEGVKASLVGQPKYIEDFTP